MMSAPPGDPESLLALAEAVVRGLKAARLTVAVAESCTGGLIAHLLTSIPGASEVFVLGVVAYANPMKQAVLGVSGETLRRHGAVSGQTAAAMAAGVRQLAGSDLGIGVTGVAGPAGGTRVKPVGTVWLGCAAATGVETWKRLLAGGRREVQAGGAREALERIRRYCERIESDH